MDDLHSWNGAICADELHEKQPRSKDDWRLDAKQEHGRAFIVVTTLPNGKMLAWYIPQGHHNGPGVPMSELTSRTVSNQASWRAVNAELVSYRRTYRWNGVITMNKLLGLPVLTQRILPRNVEAGREKSGVELDEMVERMVKGMAYFTFPSTNSYPPNSLLRPQYRYGHSVVPVDDKVLVMDGLLEGPTWELKINLGK